MGYRIDTKIAQESLLRAWTQLRRSILERHANILASGDA